MKRTLMFVLVVSSSSAWSASSIQQPIAKHLHTLSSAFACEIMTGTSLGGTTQCRNRNNPARTKARQFDKAADKKALRECIKPGNLIDDDVRKCMNGL